MSDDILDLEPSYDIRVPNDNLKNLAQKEEVKFLSIILKDKDCLMDAFSFGIKIGDDGHFWVKKNRLLYGIIHQYYKKYGAILTRSAMDSVMDSISKINKIKIDDDDRTAIRMYYDTVYNYDTPIDDYPMLKEHINNRYLQWQAYEIFKDQTEAVVKSISNQEKLIVQIRDKFNNLDNLEADSYCKCLSMKEVMPQVREYITERRDKPENNPRIKTGINALDNMYYLNPGTYTIISGMINGGKTTLMFNIAFNMAMNGHNVCYVSIEKEAFPLIIRLVSLHALVNYNRIKEGGKGNSGLNESTYNKLMLATEDIEKNIMPNFHCIQAVPGTKLTKIMSEVEKVRNKIRSDSKENQSNDIEVLIVDYLGVIGFETNHPGRPDLDEALISKRLQAYGKINHFVTIAACQLKTGSSKEIRNKAKKATSEDTSSIEIHTEDMAGSKMIIADADNGISAVLNHDSPPTKMFLYGTKARDDASRTCITLDFDGAIGRISDPEFADGYTVEVDEKLYGEDGEILEDAEDLYNNYEFIPNEQDNELDKELFGEDEEKTEEKTEKAKNNDIPEELIDDDIFGID